MIDGASFQNPFFLLLLGVVPLMYLYFKRNIERNQPRMILSSARALKEMQTWRSRLYPHLIWLKLISLAAMIIALARPQLTLKEEVVTAEGIDIVLVTDISSSMLAQDFEPNRLEVSKRVGKEFVDKRKYDRIGLVVFAGESFTQCPLTTDHRIVKDFIDELQCGMLEDGTAIGMGLASAVNRLKDSEATSKVVILLTDGVNNSGYVKPITAAEIAEEMKVKVYTIGVGSRGQALSPVSRRADGQYVFGLSNVEIDERLMKEISDMTGGQYFRATDQASLESIYEEIDKLEKTKMEVTTFKRYSEEFRKFLWAGIALLLLDWVLRKTIFDVLP